MVLLAFSLAYASDGWPPIDWQLVEQHQRENRAMLPVGECPRTDRPALLRSAGDLAPVTVERLEVFELPSAADLCARQELRLRSISTLRELLRTC